MFDGNRPLSSGLKGFGFTLIAIKVNTGPLSNGRYRVVVRHMITDVAKFGAAAEAGIKKDDLINAVNSQRTAQLTHQQVVDLIRTSEKQVSEHVHTHYTGSYTLYRFIHTKQVHTHYTGIQAGVFPPWKGQ